MKNKITILQLFSLFPSPCLELPLFGNWGSAQRGAVNIFFRLYPLIVYAMLGADQITVRNKLIFVYGM
jgi:hypothetical protein